MASPLQRFNVSSACGAERLIVHGLSKGLWQVTCSATVPRCPKAARGYVSLNFIHVT